MFEVWIVGEGNLEQQLKELSRQLGVADVVSFKGYIEHSRLPEIYSSSDIFVLPSLSEGMSNTVLEAMACGLPIVTTDTGGSKELINSNGIVLATGNAKGIADAVLELIKNEKTRWRMSQRARELAEGLSWNKVTDEYVATYEKVKMIGLPC